MKKSVFIGIVLTIALLLGAPYLSGKIAETQTLKWVDAINRESKLYGDLDVLSYHREFASSRAKYAYTPPLLLAKILQSNDAIEYSCDSQHGVWGVDFACQLERAGAYTEFVEQQLAGVDPLSMHGSLSAFGKITQTLEFDAIANLDVDGQSVSTPRAIMTIETNQAMSALAFNGQVDAFEVENENRRFSLGKISFTGDIEAIADVFLVGDFAMSLDTFSLKNAGNEVALAGFSVYSESLENGDNLDSYSIVKIASLETSDATVADVEDFTLTTELNGLDTAALLEYQALSMQLQREWLATLESSNVANSDQNTLLQMLPIIESMLKPGLEIKIAAQAKLDGTDNSVALSSLLLEPLTLAQMPLFLADPEAALKKLDSHIDASLAKSFVDLQPIVAGIIAHSPLIEVTADHYQLTLTMGNEIELNGQVISLQTLQSLALGNASM